MAEEKRDKIEDELSKIKEEMKELKEILQEKRKNADDTDDYDEEDDESSPRGFTFKLNTDFDDDEFNFDTGDIDFTLNNYLGSVMSGLSDNIKRNVQQATEGLDRMGINLERKAKRRAEKEMRRSKRDLERSVRHMKKHAKRTKNHFLNFDPKTRVIHMDELSEEELETFYETGSNLVGAISDQRRLKLLKLLEDGPAYQGDLSDKTGVKGGTFKHHMDLLMGAKYVYQEATRGRYLITRFGVEALKLAEMLYRRFEFENKSLEQEEMVTETEGIVDKLGDSEVEVLDLDEEQEIDTNEDSENYEGADEQ